MTQFDRDIIQRKYGCVRTHVDYVLYKQDESRISFDEGLLVNSEAISGACFSFFIQSNINRNRLAYKIQIHSSVEDMVSDWIEFSVNCKTLPFYMLEQIESIKNGICVFKTDDISPSLMYIYLCQMRFLEEFPDIVRIALYLDKEHKVNPYLALMCGNAIGCTNCGHSYYNYVLYTDDTIILSLTHAIKLKLYLENPRKYDTRKCNGYQSFQCFTTLNSVANLSIAIIPLKSLLDEQVVKVMGATEEKVIKSILKEITSK